MAVSRSEGVVSLTVADGRGVKPEVTTGDAGSLLAWAQSLAARFGQLLQVVGEPFWGLRLRPSCRCC